jgi:2-polyprenyl-3-methyl-5-hydroxy-6-metoxy-1,4-benzoquinol methylase
MINWKSKTKDPVDKEIRSEILDYLLSIRKPLKEDYTKYVIEECKNKKVLDIGICEHTRKRMDSNAWKHKPITENAASSLGVDIDKESLIYLQEKGYNVKFSDATTDEYLGEKFDIVHIGDVIEHVDNAVAMLKYAQRHLADGGKIIVRTPNAYNFNYIHLQNKYGTSLENMEHVAYILPMHAHELALRANLSFDNYKVIYAKGFSLAGFLHAGYFLLKYRSIRHAWAELFAKPERYSTIYVYEFKNQKL